MLKRPVFLIIAVLIFANGVMAFAADHVGSSTAGGGDLGFLVGLLNDGGMSLTNVLLILLAFKYFPAIDGLRRYLMETLPKTLEEIKKDQAAIRTDITHNSEAIRELQRSRKEFDRRHHG